MKIYIASSWRNVHQPYIVYILSHINEIIKVYDFRHPDKNDNGFSWSNIDPNWKEWDYDKYVTGLYHELVEDGFNKDFNAMKEADVCVLVLPCGMSAHLEAGFFTKHPFKKLIIYIPEKIEPELMYKMADYRCNNIDSLLFIINDLWNRWIGGKFNHD